MGQPIDIFGRTAAGRRAGHATRLIAEAGYRGTMLDVQTDVLTAYFQAVVAGQFAERAHQLLGIAEGLKSAATKRFEAGQVPEVQVTRAAIEYERAKQADSLRRAQRNASIERLAGALGVARGDLKLDSSAMLVPPSPFDISSRPDLMLLQAQVEKANADTELARVRRMPELELQARRSPWSDSPGVYGARIQLTWSLLDHGRSGFEAGAAKKRATVAMVTYDDAKLRAEAELSAIQLELDAARAQVESYRSILVSAADLVAKSQKGYSDGVGTLTDVLDATRALRETEQEAAEARLRLALALVSQYRAAGYLMEVLK